MEEDFLMQTQNLETNKEVYGEIWVYGVKETAWI